MRTRMTLQCLDDLNIPVPPVTTDRLDDIQHAVMDKGRDLAENYPGVQVRIQAIADTLVYRFTHGRFRIATWRDSEHDTMWLCYADLRREDEDYDEVIARHARGELLPAADDLRRLEDEAILDVARLVRDGAGSWVEAARAQPGEECRFTLPGGATGVVRVDRGDGVDEVWIALPTLLAQELGMARPVRDLIIAAVTEALGGADVPWEQRSSWPGRPLKHYELVYFWVA